ncbi:hypothetical protein OUZ56_032912 [Daphnia magna]|uniref:Uncharacterized protein n=1 Tax=Daphnia magna TaxID=35525 RepID=A0ABQ9ZY50_9CRUS|nr:hypothetical protein OUZ56_032912 [Daphnia magna]
MADLNVAGLQESCYLQCARDDFSLTVSVQLARKHLAPLEDRIGFHQCWSEASGYRMQQQSLSAHPTRMDCERHGRLTYLLAYNIHSQPLPNLVGLDDEHS